MAGAGIAYAPATGDLTFSSAKVASRAKRSLFLGAEARCGRVVIAARFSRPLTVFMKERSKPDEDVATLHLVLAFVIEPAFS